MDQTIDVLIVGAGPTGMGAASRLWQRNQTSWLVIERGFEAGGLAATDTTAEGFLFDYGGHVKFSHYAYFDDLLNTAMGGDGEDVWNTHKRTSHVWLKNRLVAYPFQNNLAQLDTQDQIVCLQGIVRAQVETALAQAKPRTFDEWIVRTMGAGIADLFMRPYNFKVWAYPTTMMQAEWLGERVATVDANRAIRNVLESRVEDSWGPNAVFRFPVRGGTGAMWKAVASILPADRIKYNKSVISIDADNKLVKCSDGATIRYKQLITTMPLDLTMAMVGRADLADGLLKSTSHIIGIGLRGAQPPVEAQWMYFPEDDCPFYRATMFSKYSAFNVPDASRELPTLCRAGELERELLDATERSGPYWSLMFEVSESPMKPVDTSPCRLGGREYPRVVLETIEGAINTLLCAKTDEIVSIYYRKFEYGYPTPSLHRDAAVRASLEYLKERSIWSRGRFGSWKYEVANQDHSCMLGVEAVDNILDGARELTLQYPDLVNAPGNKEMDKRFFVPSPCALE